MKRKKTTERREEEKKWKKRRKKEKRVNENHFRNAMLCQFRNQFQFSLLYRHEFELSCRVLVHSYVALNAHRRKERKKRNTQRRKPTDS